MQNGFSQLRLLIKRARRLKGKCVRGLGRSRLMQMMVNFQAGSKESVVAEDPLADQKKKPQEALSSEQRRGVI